MGRVLKNIAWVERRLANQPEFAETGQLEIVDAHNDVVLDIAKRIQPSILRGTATVTFDLGTHAEGEYALPSNTMAILSFKEPDDWAHRLTVVTDARKWDEIKLEYDSAGSQPLFVFVETEKIKFWPIPQWATADGVSVTLHTVTRPTDVTNSNFDSADPVFPREFDRAIRLGILAFLTGADQPYEIELSKFNGDYLQQAMPSLVDHSSRELGF